MNFINGKQLLEICSEKHIPISQAMFLRETNYLEQDPVDVTRKMERAYDIMKMCIRDSSFPGPHSVWQCSQQGAD